MGRMMKKLEAMGAAVAFAESAQWDTAEEILRQADRKEDRKRTEQRKQQRPRARAYRT